MSKQKRMTKTQSFSDFPTRNAEDSSIINTQQVRSTGNHTGSKTLDHLPNDFEREDDLWKLDDRQKLEQQIKINRAGNNAPRSTLSNEKGLAPPPILYKGHLVMANDDFLNNEEAVVRSQQVSYYGSEIGGGNNANSNLNHSPQQNNQRVLPKKEQEERPVSDSYRRPQSENPSEFKSLVEMERARQRRPVNLNVLVCGAQAIGKSSFVNALLGKIEDSECNKLFYKSTANAEEMRTAKTESGRQYAVSLIDMPGYSPQEEIKGYYHKVREILTTRLRESILKTREMKDRKKIIEGSAQEIEDRRVHVCLFFLVGPRVSDKDLYLMEKLQKYVNVIPVLAKADSYTTQEIYSYKAHLEDERSKRGIKWFECEEFLRAKYPTKLPELIDKKNGSAPPFLMVTGVEKIYVGGDRFVIGRKYRWGVCDMNNPEHSDFRLLEQLLIGFFSEPLIRLTALLEDQQGMRMKNRVKKESPVKKHEDTIALPIMVGIMIGVGAGIMKFFKNR